MKHNDRTDSWKEGGKGGRGGGGEEGDTRRDGEKGRGRKNEDETSVCTPKKRRPVEFPTEKEAYETSVLINDRNSLYAHFLENNVTATE